MGPGQLCGDTSLAWVGAMPFLRAPALYLSGLIALGLEAHLLL